MNKYIKRIKKKFMYLEDSTKKAIIIGGAIFLIVLIIVISNSLKSSDNFNNIKKDKNNYLVYSKVEEKKDTYFKYVPYINIKSSSVEQINTDIDNYVDKYLNVEKAIVTYEYNINGIILSVVLTIADYQKDYAPEIYFRTYNINLNTRELISDASLLEFFQINESKVYSIIETKFKEYYDDLVKEGYYEPSECDYTCFLGYRDVNNYLDNVNYYVRNGDLIAYKPFAFYSIFGDEEYFKSEHFEFLLVETEKN